MLKKHILNNMLKGTQNTWKIHNAGTHHCYKIYNYLQIKLHHYNIPFLDLLLDRHVL